MYSKILLFSIYVIIDSLSAKKMTEVTLAVQDRVELLKQQIAEQIMTKLNPVDSYQPEIEAVNENVDYEDHSNDPITPISEKDPRKKHGKFKLKEIKTTKDLKLRKDSVSERNEPKKIIERIKPIVRKHKTEKMVKKSIATDVFYRRMLPKDWTKTMIYWTHCQDLITPFLTGHKTNMSHAKHISYEDHVVVRLLQLLTEDITDHTKDDIHSILYQISNLQLRLYQWEVAAIKLLLNVINKDETKRHSFKTIKYGLKRIFESWHLSLGSNPNVLLKQTRIFRPPCVKITENEGSTKTSKTVRYTKSVKRKLPCKETDVGRDDCEDWE